MEGYKTPEYIRRNQKKYYEKNKNNPEFQARRKEIKQKSYEKRKQEKEAERENLKLRYFQALQTAEEILELLNNDLE